MTANKDLKKIVRARMQKTGESYTAARLHVVKASPATQPGPVVAKLAREDYATLAGMSDDSVKKATGSDWAKWVRTLDAENAATMPHVEIARLMKSKFNATPWWAQMVTVGYERIRGLRQKRQSREGEFNINTSKTIAAPAADIFDAFRLARTRAKWLEGAKLTLRTSIPHRSLRLRWEDDTPVDVQIDVMPTGKLRVSVAHRKLATREEADRLKAFWKRSLALLALYLTAND